ncbi:MAG TPA: hypothetical protein ENN49_02890 [Bacteroidales bacterium]|nr:hypothetical protein [Bacteroidales bacterium]
MKEKYKEILSQLYYFSLCLLAFSIPVSYRLSLYVLGLALVLSVFIFSISGKLRALLQNKINLGFILFWLIHAVSLTYSSDLNYGLTDVFQKVSMGLLPFIFLPFVPEEQVNERIKKWFLVGLFGISFFFLVRALIHSTYFTPVGIFFKPNPFGAPWENHFFYERFVEPFHPTYFSMYLSLGIAFIASYVKKIKEIRSKVLYDLAWIFLLVIVFLTSSKIGILVSALVSLITTFWIIKRRGKFVLAVVLTFFTVVGGQIILKNERVRSTINQIYQYFQGKEIENELARNNLVRFDIWRTFPDVFQDNSIFTGVGVGGVKRALARVYEKKGIEFAYQKQLNAHNQFIQTLVACGILGLLFLLTIIGYAFWLSYKNRDMVLLLFMLIIFINFMFESMLERVFGVIFFAFFLLFLTSNFTKEQKNRAA